MNFSKTIDPSKYANIKQSKIFFHIKTFSHNLDTFSVIYRIYNTNIHHKQHSETNQNSSEHFQNILLYTSSRIKIRWKIPEKKQPKVPPHPPDHEFHHDTHSTSQSILKNSVCRVSESTSWQWHYVLHFFEQTSAANCWNERVSVASVRLSQRTLTFGHISFRLLVAFVISRCVVIPRIVVLMCVCV